MGGGGVHRGDIVSTTAPLLTPGTAPLFTPGNAPQAHLQVGTVQETGVQKVLRIRNDGWFIIPDSTFAYKARPLTQGLEKRSLWNVPYIQLCEWALHCQERIWTCRIRIPDLRHWFNWVSLKNILSRSNRKKFGIRPGPQYHTSFKTKIFCFRKFKKKF